MANNLPAFFIEDVRLEIIDETSFTDNEISSYARKSVNKVAPLLNTDTTAIDGVSTYDFTVSGAMGHDYWEIIKLATVAELLGYYKHKMIAEGVGVSVGLGSERIDTKTLLLTVKSLTTDANNALRQKLLAYNMLNVQGSSVDLYFSETTW